MDSIQELENRITTLSESKEKVDLLIDLAIGFRSSKIENSIIIINQAEELAKKISYNYGKAVSLFNNGINHRLLCKYEIALKYFDTALKIFETEKEVVKQAQCLNSISNVYADLGNEKEALKLLIKSYDLLESTDDGSMKASVLTNLGVLYHEKGDHSRALEYYLKANQIYNDYNIGIKTMILPNNIAEVYVALRDFDTALKYLFMSLKLSENSNLDKGLVLLNIGSTYIDMKLYEEGLKYTNDSLNILENTGYIVGICGAMCGLAEIYRGMNDFDKALEYELKAYNKFKQNNDKKGEIKTLHELGVTYLKQEYFPDAEKYFIESLNLSLNNNFDIDIIKNYIQLGKLMLKLGKDEVGFNFLEKGLKIAIENNDKKDIIEFHKVFYEGYKLYGDSTKALYHHELYHKAEQDISHIEADKKLKAITIEYQIKSAEKDKEIYRLRNIELASLNEKLTHLNEEKSEFLGVAAHDLKNPMSGIMMVARRMKNNADKLTAEQIAESSFAIEETTEKMFEIVTKILDVTAIESGKRNIEISEIDPVVIANLVNYDYRQKAESKNIQIDFYSDFQGKLKTDKISLRQILDNLISNAVKFSHQDKKIFFRVLQNNYYVRFEVEDQGPGLTDCDKTKLFGKFSRLSAQPTAGENSTGLGLSIVKKLTEMLGGKIWCESEHGKGAKFILEIPING